MNNELRKKLENLKDEKNALFVAKLCPTLSADIILGIKIPILRNIAKDIVKNNIELNNKNFKYLEELIIEGLTIGYSKINIKDKCGLLRVFIPKINSWYVNDIVSSSIKCKNNEDKNILWNFVLECLNSNENYSIRFGITLIIGNFIIDEYLDDVIKNLDSIKNDDYYVKMAIAWALSFVGIKYYDKLLKYLENDNNLDTFTYNKTIQKICESRRISIDKKNKLKSMKK